MFSKITVGKYCVLLLAFLLLTSCIGKIGEAPPPPTDRKFSGAQCLSKMQPVVSAFFKGEAEVPEVEETWDCVADALDSFKRYVRGRTEDRYMAQEVATFLEDNFLDLESGERMSPALQREFMKFKQLLVGGSGEYIRRDELDKAKAVIYQLRSISVSLNPYMKVIAMKWSATSSTHLKEDMEYFEESNMALQNAARTLAQVIENNGREYILSDFASFARELEKFFKEDWPLSRQIARYMPVVKKVKKAVAGGDENSISPKEWRRFALLGARGYVQYLRYHYFIESVPETGTGYRLTYLSRTVEDIFSVFYDLVGEKPEGMVSRDEVTDLLTTLSQVWPDFRVSPNLVLEVMKVKQLLFGGSVDSWTAHDFDTARLKVDRIKFLVERFLPYWKVYGLDWDPEMMDPSQARQFFKEAQFNLEATGRDLGALLETAYNLEDLERLAQEVDALYPQATGQSFAPVIRKYLPLVVELKNIIFSGRDATLGRSQWSPFLGFTARFYSTYLYHHYFVAETGRSLHGLTHRSVFANQAVNLLRDLLITKERPEVTGDEVLALLKQGLRLGVLPESIKPSSLEGLVDVILNNVLLSPERRLTGERPDRLTLESLELLRRELLIWIEGDIFIAAATEHLGPDQELTSQELLERIEAAQADETSSEDTRTTLRELSLSLNGPVPMTVDEQGRLLISAFPAQGYNARSLFELNSNRAITRVLIRATAGDLRRIESYAGITVQEFESLFHRLRPLLVDAGLLAPNNATFAASRFREANIFTPHSDGNNLASHTEIVDELGMIFSGLRLNALLEDALKKDCLGGADKLPATTPVKVSCARDSYRQTVSEALSSMPDFLNYLDEFSKSQWTRFMNNIFKAAGYQPNSRGEAQLGDISLSPHVIQYIEMIYARFDKNKDGFISASDAVRAFPAFKGIMKELAKEALENGDLKERHLVDLFTYILRYGKPPETMMEKVKFALFWRGKPEKWDTWASRSKVAEILGYIADQVNKTAKVSLPSLRGIPPEDLSAELETHLEAAF